MNSNEPSGKIGEQFFDNHLRNNCGRYRHEVVVGPGFGVDVAIVDLPGGLSMATTSDPLSLIPSLGLQESAWLSVQLKANDMATTGVAPMYGQFVLNLPAGFAAQDFNIYWQYIHQYCNQIGMAITGGHTGFIEGQNSTIAGGGTFTAVASTGRMLVSKMAQPGDAILVTKTAAMSSAAILAMSFPQTVKNKAGIDFYQQACESFYQTSSLADALAAVGKSGEYRHEITAMHDVTEGGLLGAIYEMAVASGNGAVIHHHLLPVAEVQAAVCNVFDLDARYCIGAGSMVITCKPQHALAVIQRLGSQGIACTQVGYMTVKDQGILLEEHEVQQPLIYNNTDPYWAAFFKAYNAGWK